MAVDLSAMRKLFEVGALKEAIVAPAPMEKGAGCCWSTVRTVLKST